MADDGLRRREHESSLRGYEHEFARAAEQLRVAAAAGLARVSDAQKLQLYALFKQASEGDCAKSQPSAFQPVERAKWNGWQSLQGMDATVAKRRYVLQVIELLPSFRMPTDDAAAGESGAGASRASPSHASPAAPSPAFAEPPALRREPRYLRAAATPTRLTSLCARLEQPVDALSHGVILLQVIGFVALVGAFVFAATRVALPFCREQIAQHFGAESARALIKALTPALWFALGYLFVTAIRSRIFSWRLLTGEFVWLDIISPRARAARSRRLQRRQRRRAEREPEQPPKSPTTLLLEKLGIRVADGASSGEAGSTALETPRLELALDENPDAVCFGDATTVFPFTLEQTASVFYRKFKEPLPDPSSPQLVAIEVLEEHRFEEFDAVFRRRKLQFKNNAPYLIKRQFASEFVEFIEDSLLDQRNRIFYVYSRNESFQSLGSMEDFSVYRVAGDADQWTELSQGARLQITSSSIGFLRSTIESLVSSSYAKNIPRTREYHRERLCEEFGAPEPSPVTSEDDE